MSPRWTAALAFGWLLSSAASPAAATTLFGLVDTGELFASADAGTTWELRSTLPISDAVGLVAGATSNDLILGTRSGVVYESTDAGVSWTAVGAVAAADVAALAVRPGVGLLLLTATGTVWISDDGGSSFTTLSALTGSNHVSLAFSDSGQLYALTETGEVAESLDGGGSWSTIGAITVSDAVEIVASGPALFAMTETGEVSRSDDAGVTWQTIGTLSQVGTSSLVEDPGADLLVAVTRQGVVATSPDGVTWTWVGTINQLSVMSLANDEPGQIGVADQGVPELRFAAGLPWPNPGVLGSAVVFPMSLPQGDTVELAVYDARGRLVARPSPHFFASGGAQRIAWHPGALPAGVYFARLTAGSGVTAEVRWTLLR